MRLVRHNFAVERTRFARRSPRRYTDQEDGGEADMVKLSPSGIHILECHDCTGGSGVFESVCLVALEQDRSLHDRALRLFSPETVSS